MTTSSKDWSKLVESVMLVEQWKHHDISHRKIGFKMICLWHVGTDLLDVNIQHSRTSNEHFVWTEMIC
jgi:hypothetical protein